MSKVLTMRKPEPPTEETLRAEAEAFLRARGRTFEEPTEERVWRELRKMYDELGPRDPLPTVTAVTQRLGLKSSTNVSHALKRLLAQHRVYRHGTASRPTWVPLERKE